MASDHWQINWVLLPSLTFWLNASPYHVDSVTKYEATVPRVFRQAAVRRILTNSIACNFIPSGHLWVAVLFRQEGAEL